MILYQQYQKYHQESRETKMKEKFISAIMGGVFIALGAITYLCIPYPIVGAMFFSTGIALVFQFERLLFTKVVPMAVLAKKYTLIDIVVTWIGNFIGAFIIALFTHYSRVEGKILDSLQHTVELKFNDSPISLFIMGIFCAVFVSYAVFLGQRYKMDTFAHIVLVWFLITAFVIAGFDHIVANFYYLSAYSIAFGLKLTAIIKVIVFVTLGNIAGGCIVGLIERNRLKTI